MAEHTRVFVVESDQPLGQFLDVSIEQFISGEDIDVSVEEVKPDQ